MRAIAALALARLASASSVSSTLAAYQKFTDEMVAKFEKKQGQPADVTDGSQDTVTDVSADVMATANTAAAAAGEAQNTTEYDVQVSTDGGSGVASSGDEQTIQQVIGWLDALYTDSLKVDHEEDVDLMLQCQARIDACEDPNKDSSSPGNAAHDYDGQDSKVLYKRIGSVCQGSGLAQSSWTGGPPTFDDTAETQALLEDVGGTMTANMLYGTITQHGFLLPSVSNPAQDDTDPMFNFAVDAPWVEENSLWATMHNQCMRHKVCRIEHQKKECGDNTYNGLDYGQKHECDAYDTKRKTAANQFPTCARKPSSATCNPEGSAAVEGCIQVKDALSDDFIRQEWWFVESNTVESCLDEVAEWFVGCTLDTGAQSNQDTQNTCVGAEGVWWWYQECDLAIKKCAEATLTCDDIQHEFETAACDWTKERTRSCHEHLTCYEHEIEECAKNCRLIQHRVIGRKAELEIIQRIKCMLKALLANNDEHEGEVADDGTDLSRALIDNTDDGTKTSRLERCKTMGDFVHDGAARVGRGSDGDGTDGTGTQGTYQLTIDNGNGDTGGLDLLNITCQGPKKKTTTLKQFDSAPTKPANYPVSPSADAALVSTAASHKWMIDLNGNALGDGVEEFDMHIDSYWMPGWRKSDYMAWADEYPRGSQGDKVTECGGDNVLGVSCGDEKKVTIEMEEETTLYVGATAERLSISAAHMYNSKTGSATTPTAATWSGYSADGSAYSYSGSATGSTRRMVHRMARKYQKWGYGCSTGYRPCTSSFIRESYGFLASHDDAARAPCTSCDGTFTNAQGTSDSGSTMDDPCNWNTQMTHSANDAVRFDSGDEQGLDDARDNAGQHGRDDTDLAICECFHSRDPNFCTTDMASEHKHCSGGSTPLSTKYCHDDHRNTNWDLNVEAVHAFDSR